jgi:hypothetical protein
MWEELADKIVLLIRPALLKKTHVDSDPKVNGEVHAA